MASKISSDESSSSDDDLYNNFTKYKAKAAHALKGVKAANGKNCKQSRKSERTLEQISLGSSDIEVFTPCELSRNFTSPIDVDSEEICLLSTVDTSLNADVIDLSEANSADCPPSPLLVKSPPSSANVCTINISSKGQQKMFFCDLYEPLINVIEEFAERTNVDPKRVNLYTKQYKRCNPKDTPLALGLSEKCNTIDLDAFEDLEQSEVKTVQLKFQMKDRRPVIVRALPDASFASLKELFCTDHHLELSKTRFVLGSMDIIADDETPNSLGLEDGDCIDVFILDI